MHEWVAALTLAFLPLFVAWCTHLTDYPYHRRYVLSCIAGISILAEFVASRVPIGRQRFLVRALALFLVVYLCGRFIELKWKHWNIQQQHAAVCTGVAQLPYCSGSVVVADAILYLELQQHAPPEVAQRFVYVSSLSEALRHAGTDTNDRALQALAPWAGFKVEDYESFLAHRQTFFMVGQGSWIGPALTQSGWVMKEKGRAGRWPVLEVTR